ncbi:MAG: O-antigen ligase family protein [Mycetocola sp.]
MQQPTGLWAILYRAAGEVSAAKAFTTTAIGFVFLAPLLRDTVGHAVVGGGLVALLGIGIAILTASHERIDRPVRIPLTVVLVLAWMALSLLWSDYSGHTLLAVAEQVTIAALAITVGLLRDLIQIVRAVGNVLRTLLAVSLVIEILSGLVFHVPFSSLAIQGNIGDGGPIQGLFLTRNMLGFVSLIALVTFAIEGVTRSVQRPVLIFSLVLASGMIMLSQSPVTLLMLVVLAIAAGPIALIRHLPAGVRPRIQFALASALVLGVVGGWLVRGRLIAILDAASEMDTRSDLWSAIGRAIRVEPITGWGWAGEWIGGRAPFVGINISVRGSHATALNAWLDVALQLGAVGLFLLAALSVIALGRSWILASERRTVSVVWPALILVLLGASSIAESFMLRDAGWFLLVLCAVQASSRLRDKLPVARRPAPSP